MTGRESLRAFYETIRYLEKDADLAGADSVAMYLRLAAIEADNLVRAIDNAKAMWPTVGETQRLSLYKMTHVQDIK